MIENSQKIKYFIYARKSTESEDRQILSIGSQIDALKEMAIKYGLDIVGTYSESKSAKQPGREVFNDIIVKIEQGEAQGLLCWKLDRLARNPVDGGTISWLLQRGTIKHIKTPERDYFPKDNVILMNVEFGMANQFILDLKTNTQRGLMAKVKSGWYPCVSKPGYMGDKFAQKGEKTILVDPERFPLIRNAFELLLTGLHTAPKILDKLNNDWGYRTPLKKRRGGKPMSESTIYRIFNDQFYYGKFEYPMGSGNWFDGKHEKMITENEFWRVQEILGRKGKPKPKTHSFAFTGQITCGECDSMITAEEKFKTNKGNGLVHHYTYYHCTKKKLPNCSQKSIEVKELEKQIDECLQKIEIQEEFKDWAIGWLNKMNDEESGSREAIFKSQQNTLLEIEKQLNNLTQMKIKEQVTDGEFAEHKERLMKERSKLKEKLGDTEQGGDNWREQIEKTFEFACHARYWFKNGNLETKKAILAALGSNFTLKDRKLQIQLQKPFEIVSKGFADICVAQIRLEPAINSMVGAQIGVLTPNKAQKGGLRESNP